MREIKFFAPSDHGRIINGSDVFAVGYYYYYIIKKDYAGSTNTVLRIEKKMARNLFTRFVLLGYGFWIIVFPSTSVLVIRHA